MSFPGHFGLINFPYTILNPYFVSEVAQILKKICPGCKSVRRDKVKVRYYTLSTETWYYIINMNFSYNLLFL